MIDLYKYLEKYYNENNLEKQFNNINLINRLRLNKISKKEYHIELDYYEVIACLKEKIMTEEYTKEEIKKLVRLSKGDVLDYGAGIGDLSLEVAKKGLAVTYYEINEACSKFASFLFDEWNVKSKINYNIGIQYDTIFAINVIDHLDNPLEVLKMFHNILSEDGILIITVSYEEEFNPVHISNKTDICVIEDYLYSAFTEIEVEEKDYHQRVFKKIEEVLMIPKDKNDFMILPPIDEIDFKCIKIKLSESVELVKKQGKYYARIIFPYKETISIEKELFIVLSKIENEVFIEDLYECVGEYFSIKNFREEFKEVIINLWNQRIIRGKYYIERG